MYDDFVDKYSKSEGKDYGEIQRSKMFNKSTKRAFIILFILLAFAIGILAGYSAISSNQQNTTPNVTISDSAFSANQTITQQTNISADTSNITYNNTKKTTRKKQPLKSHQVQIHHQVHLHPDRIVVHHQAVKNSLVQVHQIQVKKVVILQGVIKKLGLKYEIK